LCGTLLVLSLPSNSQSQTNQAPTPQEALNQYRINQVVRDYLTIPYGMQLTVLANAARSGNGRIDPGAIQKPLEDASMNITVSDIKLGQTADIATRLFTEFVTLPDPNQEVILVSVLKPEGSGPYGSITAKWGPMEKDPDADPNSLTTMTMKQFLEKMGDLTGTIFDKYISYTVSLSYQGRSLKYKAMHVLPAYAEDPQMMQHVDMFLQGTRYSQAPAAFRPDHIMRSSWRDIPAMHDWLVSHAIPDEECAGVNAGTMCCSKGRCGLRKSESDRRMSNPVTFQGGPGPQGLTVQPALSSCTFTDPEDCACDQSNCVALSYPFSDTLYRVLHIVAI
jgi:hypothetical protein